MAIILAANYWLVGNKASPDNVFSGPAAAYVAASDAGYVAFLAGGNLPSRIAFDGELAQIFWKAGNLALAAAAGVTSLGAEGGMSPSDAVGLLAALGIAVTSSGTPALNGTYGADPASRSNLMGLLLGYSLRGTFPAGASSFPYLDIADAPHSMTQPQLQAVGATVEDYYAALVAWGMEFAVNPAAAPPGAAAGIA